MKHRFALMLGVASSLWIAGVPLAWAEAPARLAQPSAAAIVSPERLANIDRYIGADIEKGIVPGGVLTIFKDGQPVYEKVWGERDPQTKAPMTADAIFRIYSMSKPITTVAAMMLVEEGKLALEEPLSKYIPAFKDVQVGVENKGESGQTTLALAPAKKPITIQDLMRHTSGITYGFFGEGAVKKAYVDQHVFQGDSTTRNLPHALRKCRLPISRERHGTIATRPTFSAASSRWSPVSRSLRS
jgi:CubicO group peptidase (beta-lactamase class C family)